MTEQAQEQLTLSIRFRDQHDFDSFFMGANIQAVTALKQLCASEGEPYIFIWGSEGAGCSHLLQAVCQQATQQGLTSAYLPMAELIKLNPLLLDGMESLDILCIDNIEQLEGLLEWQEALFHLFNRAREQHTRLLIAAHQSPRYMPFALKDLTSRLCQGVIFQISAMNDEEKAAAFVQRAHKRGIRLSDEVVHYILSRCPRQTQALFHILDQLDRRSLQAGRKLTIPFIRDVLGWG